MGGRSDFHSGIDAEAATVVALEGVFDAEWYRHQNPDIVACGLDPILHFIRYGIGEWRDPNPFFDCHWYREHYADVGASGIHPLLHYLQAGAGELRNPHPSFDAVYYVDEHPEAAANPMVFHARIGRARGYLTERCIDIRDYLPSELPVMQAPSRIFVDVVIPVYRGLVETRRCIESVLADASKPLGRVIVVDDRSPDVELVSWLEELAERRLITLLRNKKNVGFVTSVNRGIEAAGNRDVVLLNSDTEVPLGWLRRLAAHAYANPRIATVSPLSNNATICSYPANDGGPLVLGHTLGEIDGACQVVNVGRWVDTPTTVGFCMYITRKALREVGNFDAARFTVGYGEENDFCLRATELGWAHRIGCDIFVYHAGSVSFGDRAGKLSARAMQLILERYPDYRKVIARHVRLGMIEPVRFTLTAALFRQSGLPIILMVTHGLGGGIRRHIEALVERFADKARFLMLAATERGATLSVPSLLGHPSLTLPRGRTDDLLAVLRSMTVSRVHFHHVLGVDADLRSIVRRLGVPFDVTVHDYYLICPQINLLPSRDGLYCHEPGIAACNGCIANQSSHGARDIVTWRGQYSWLLHEADRVLCPSLDVIERLGRYGVDGNLILAPHDAVEGGPWRVNIVAPEKGKLRVAVLGTLAPHKGARTVASVAALLDTKAIELHLIGDIDGLFSDPALKRMRVTGRYRDSELPDLIATVKPHLIWFPGVWPETFSYTLSAAIDAAVPIAGIRIGAFPERLVGRPMTWLVDVATSPEAWIQLFDEIRRCLTEDVVRCETAMRLKTSDFYARDYLRLGAPRGLTRSKVRAPRQRVVVIPERFEAGFPTPCAYIRLLQPLYHPVMAADAEVSISTASDVFNCSADIYVTQRHAIPDIETADRLAEHARGQGATLVFDLDDDLLTIPHTHPDAETLRPRRKVVRRMLTIADQVWVSTAALGERIGRSRPDAVVMENRLDERIWIPAMRPGNRGTVRILCMGTATHDRDFAMIEPALIRLKEEYGDGVAIDVIGVTNQRDFPPGLNRISPPIAAMRSYPGFVNWLVSSGVGWDVGLAPLLDTPFNNCKSSIKAMDYAAMGMVVLASDTPVYRGSLADGFAGKLVVNTASAWFAALDRLVRDRDGRLVIAGMAREAFMSRGSLVSHTGTRQAVWKALTQSGRRRAA